MNAYRVKNICILNSEIKTRLASEWFNKSGDRECISSVCMPSGCVATSWRQSKSNILVLILQGPVICLAGAGIGSLEVCAKISQSFSIPAIDLGRVLSIIRSRVNKSVGARLITEWKQHA